MKIRNLMKYIMVVLFMGIGTTSVMAQKNIDKLLDEIEKRNDASVNSVTKRDPKTRKITSVVKSFTLKDDQIAERLIEAFEKDEEYTVTAIKDMPNGRKEMNKVNFTFIFQKNNEKLTYTFHVDPSGRIYLSVIIKQGRPGDIDASDISLYFDKEQMKELQKSIQESLKGLKMKNISQLEFDKLGCTITADELKVHL